MSSNEKGSYGPYRFSRIGRKRLIENEPKLGDLSQYTFAPEDTTFNYENSTSLPKNNDKFQDKDLNVTVVGDEINEAIIDRNLKKEGLSFFRIDKLYVSNIGTPTALKDVRVKMWMWSSKYANALVDTADELITQVDISSLSDRVFVYEPGEWPSGEDLGNLSFIEGIDLLSDLNNPNGVTQAEFSNQTPEYDPEDMFLTHTNKNGLEFTQIIDEKVFNPIFLIFECRGHRDKQSGTDNRHSMWQVFQINNYDLFTNAPQNPVGKTTTLEFDQMHAREMLEYLGGGDVDDPPFKITDLQITIKTQDTNNLPFSENSSTEDDYVDFFSLVENPMPFNFYGDDRNSMLNLSPRNQINSEYLSGKNMNYMFPDFYPKQLIYTDGGLGSPEIDLQQYRYNYLQSYQDLASAPGQVSFFFEYVRPDDSTMQNMNLSDINPDSGEVLSTFFYFVIDWDDKDDKIKTLNDWLDTRPTTIEDLVELQKDNLYLPVKDQMTYDSDSNKYNNIETEYEGRVSNIYTTPGIKTIKTIMFSIYEPDNIFYGNKTGRWKLITSRFYLDIPSNQKPDFAEVGGADYTTIPWPYPAPVIGGVDKESKYKKSVQDAISSGNITDTDIIDEQLLIEANDNDELGKSITNLDLEQIRYFDKSYGLNKLLGLVYNEEFLGQPVYLTSSDHLRTLTGYNGGGIITGDLPMSITELSWSTVGETNPAFGENGYLLASHTYEELRDLWRIIDLNPSYEYHPILSYMRDEYGGVYSSLDISKENWIYDLNDFETFLYDGYISAETSVFVNAMALSIYKHKVGLWPTVDYANLLNEQDAQQWNNYGRPDIAYYIQQILAGEVQPQPPLIDEEGNQTFDYDGEGGGGIIEGGIDGSEPHFQGGVPGGSGGGIIIGGEEQDYDTDFPPPIPALELLAPNIVTQYQSGDTLTIDWYEVNDRIINEFNGGEYGVSYYYDLAQQSVADGFSGEQYFPNTWNQINIYLDKKVFIDGNANNYEYVQDIYIGTFNLIPPGETEVESLNTMATERRFNYTIPMIYGADYTENYKVRLVAAVGSYSRETTMVGGDIQITWKQFGGDEPEYGARPKKTFENPVSVVLDSDLPNPYTDTDYWDGTLNKFPEESSVGQIFITDNQSIDLKDNCKLELNTGNLTDNTLYDSSGNSVKGLLIGDYKVKKTRRGDSMLRDSFVKIPKKETNNSDGAL